MLTLNFDAVDPGTAVLLEPIARRHEAAHLPEGCEGGIEFVYSYSIATECYVLTCSRRTFTVAASSKLGFLYGLGKCLRRFAAGDFSSRTVRFRPSKVMRGIYFATHFHNAYITSTLEELTTYIEDLALWGMNVLTVWYDIHTFHSTADPEAQALAARIRAIFTVCRRLGVTPMLGMLANEAFASSDPAVRAEWAGGQNGYTSAPQGHYHVEICPNRDGGMQAILETKAEVLSLFADCPPGAVWLWPYDQGGCTCSKCAPWGGNGYLTTVRKVIPFIRKALPDCPILLSTWYFGLFTGQREWDMFLSAKDEIADLADGLIAEFPFDLKFPRFLDGFPLPAFGFEELSMRGASPWGGFGANPMPGYIAELNEMELPHQRGGFLYSEGVFEDINKAVLLSLFCDSDREVDEILDEYAVYEFGCGGDAMVQILRDLEETLPRHEAPDERGEMRFVIERPEKVLSIAARVDLIHPTLDEAMRESLRWRLIYLRAQIDRALVEHDFYTSDECEALYRQLTLLCHAEDADFIVAPPTRESLARKHAVI